MSNGVLHMSKVMDHRQEARRRRRLKCTRPRETVLGTGWSYSLTARNVIVETTERMAREEATSPGAWVLCIQDS